MKPVTEPMRAVLLQAQKNGGIIPKIFYPAGQMRLIIAGLYRRGLIHEINGMWVLNNDGWLYK